MDIARHLASRDAFSKKMESVTGQLQQISSSTLAALRPPPGPYLLLYHHSTTLRRVGELSTIVRRLYENRVELLKHDLVRDLARRQAGPPTNPISPEQQELMARAHDVDGQIQLDFQTMLLFSGIALDDWAHMAGYVYGVSKPRKCAFVRVVEDDGVGELKELWANHKEAILWLDAFTRLFRNKFIVHQEQPWQMGHTHSLARLDWSFWTPVAAGWLSDAQMKAREGELEVLEVEAGVSPTDHIHERVLRLLKSIAKFDVKGRAKVRALAEQLGFQTPSFQEFSHRLADFLFAANETLIQRIKDHPNSINLGKPIH